MKPAALTDGRPGAAERASPETRLGVMRETDTARPGPGPFVLLVPGAMVPLMHLSLPDTLTGVAREQVARRQLADSTGVAGSSLEIRPFARNPLRERWTRLLVATARDAAIWRGRKAALGPDCRAVLPEYLALPAAEGLWTVQADATGVSARLGLGDAFSGEPELARVLLELARAEAAPKAVLRLGIPCGPVDAVLDGLGVPVHTDPGRLGKPGAATLRRFANGELTFDLSRDPAAAANALRNNVRQWRLPVALLVLALALWSAGTLVRLADLRSQAAGARLAVTTLVRETFVPDGPILDARAQVLQALAAMQADADSSGESADPMDLLRRAGEVSAAQAAVLGRAQSLPDSGLEIDLTLPDFAALDQMVLALEAAQINVEIGDASATDAATVNAVLILREKGR